MPKKEKGAKKKKSNNPFKVWGSYIGPPAYIIIMLLLSYIQNNFCKDCLELFKSIAKFPAGYFIQPRGVPWILDVGTAFLMLFWNLIFYFFAGWGVHLIIRNYKNGKK